MEQKLLDIMNEISLSENEMLWYICSKCGSINKLNGAMNCPNCKSFNSADSVYPHFAAMDMAYSLVLLKEISKETQKQLIKEAVDWLENELKIDSSYDDVNYLLQSISKLRNKNFPFDMEQLDELISKRLRISSPDDIDKIAFELLSGGYINHLFKPFIITSASFIELLFKDYAKVVLKARLGEISGNKMLDLYEYKSIKDLIELLDVISEDNVKDEMNKVEPSFFERWDTLRNERNEIIHNNEIYVYSEKVTDTFNIAKSAVKVFATLKSQYIKKK